MDLPEARFGRKADATRVADDGAIRWLICLRSGYATQADALDYQRWRIAHPEHERAARELALLWRMLAEAARYIAMPACPCTECTNYHAACWVSRRRRRSSLRRRRWHSMAGR